MDEISGFSALETRNGNLLKLEVSVRFQPPFKFGIHIVYKGFPQLKLTET